MFKFCPKASYAVDTPKTSNSGKDKQDNVSKTLRYRSYAILLFGVFATVGVGYVMYSLYSKAETEEFNRDYDLLSNGIIQATGFSLNLLNAAGAHTAAIYSTEFPDPAMWPNVAHAGFGAMMDPIVGTLKVKNINHIPLVLPEELQSFEDFAYEFFDNDTESMPDIGVSPFGKGVFAVNASTGEKFHDTTGVTDFSSKAFLAPVFQVVDVAMNAPAVMLNTHYEKNRGLAIDASANCFHQKVVAGEPTRGCGALTDIISLLQDSEPLPSAILYYPEFPAHNSSKLTGFVGVVFNWDTILASTVLNFKEKERNKVVLHLHSSSGNCETYIASGEEVTYIGTGAQLNNKYKSEYKKSGQLGDNIETAEDSTGYLLTVFPHEDMVNEYTSDTPLIIALATACSMLVATFFIFYVDFFITSQVYEAKITSSLRRMFLRYVSHELRSPLNAVYMGIVDLLSRDEFHVVRIKSELGGVDANGAPTGSSKSTAHDHEEVSMLRVAKDIKRDTEMAMVVLDDLVTYVDLIDVKNTKAGSLKPPIVCMRHLAVECGKSIQHIFNEYGLTCSLDPFHSGASMSPEGVPRFYTVRGQASDFKLMFTYMLKVATKMCLEGNDIKLIFVYNASPVSKKFHDGKITGPTITTMIQFPNSTLLPSDMLAITRGVSNTSAFELDKLRGKTSFDSTDLGNWIVFHIAAKYHGAVDVVSDDQCLTTMSFEFPYVQDVCVHCQQEVPVDTSFGLIEQESNELLPTEEESENEAEKTEDNSDLKSVVLSPNMTMSGTVCVATDTDHATLSGKPMLPPLIGESIYTEAADNPNDNCALQTTVKLSRRPKGSLGTSNNDATEVEPKPHLKLRILVVDDVPSNRKILSRLLTKLGYTCFLACDGQEVLRNIIDEGLRVDAICLDFEMPIMDGPTAASRLRDMGETFPIVGVTGNVLPADVEYFMSKGVNAVVGKPVNVSFLDAALQRLVYERREKDKMEHKYVFNSSPCEECGEGIEVPQRLVNEV